jgi:geranylgeranyl diphosphate synthase type 3
MLHNASLLIDDIQDNSKLRRGVPVAHHIYGVPLTINTANYIYFLAMQKALTLQHPDVTKIFVGLFKKKLFARLS